MKRRVFLGSVGVAAAGFSYAAKQPQNTTVRDEDSASDNGSLAGKSLEDLRNDYRQWLRLGRTKALFHETDKYRSSFSRQISPRASTFA